MCGGIGRRAEGELRHAQKFFGSFSQKRTKEKKSFSKKEARSLRCWG
jgi:hypothetical protein